MFQPWAAHVVAWLARVFLLTLVRQRKWPCGHRWSTLLAPKSNHYLRVSAVSAVEFDNFVVVLVQ